MGHKFLKWTPENIDSKEIMIILTQNKLYYYNLKKLLIYNRNEIKIAYDGGIVKSLDYSYTSPITEISNPKEIKDFLKSNVDDPEDYWKFEKFLFDHS